MTDRDVAEIERLLAPLAEKASLGEGLAPGDARAMWQIASIYERNCLREGVDRAMENAMQLDPRLQFVTEANARVLMRSAGILLYRPDLAVQMAAELGKGGSTNAPYYKAWQTFASKEVPLTGSNPFVEPAWKWDDLQKASEDLASFGQAQDLLCCGEAFSESSRALSGMKNQEARSFANMNRSIRCLDGYMTLPGLSRRQRAEAWQRKGEALYYSVYHNDDYKKLSLAATEKAVMFWPRPRWVVHFATRQCENGVADQNSERMLVDAIKADPSAAPYIRMVVFFLTKMQTRGDCDFAMKLAQWVGEQYWNDPATTLQIATYLSDYDPVESIKFFEQTTRLRGGLNRLTDHERAGWAIAEWNRRAIQGLKPDPQAIARSFGLVQADGSFSKYALTYFAGIGDFKDALKALDASDQSGARADLLRGEFAQQCGRLHEAGMAFLRCRARRDPTLGDIDLAEVRVSLAEINGQEAAKALLPTKWMRGLDVNVGSARYCHYEWVFDARLRWIAGQRESAVQLLSSFLNDWNNLHLRARYVPLLHRWRSVLSRGRANTSADNGPRSVRAISGTSKNLRNRNRGTLDYLV